MGSKPSISLPVAILIGCGMIGVGLIVGPWVRAEPGVRPEPEVPSAPTVVVRPPEAVAADARETLAYQRTALRTRCPIEPGQRFEFRLNVTFDAAGFEVARGIVENRDNPRSTTAACVSAAISPLRVPAPGAVTFVEVPLALP